MKSNCAHIAGIALLGLATAAQAAVIGFEPFDEQGLTFDRGDSLQAQGYTITQRHDSPGLLFAGDTAGSYASNGTASLYATSNAMFTGDPDAVTAFGIHGGPTGIFNFAMFELGGGNLGFLDPFGAGAVEPWALAVTLLGTFTDNSQMSVSFAIDQTSTGLAAFAVNWSNLVDLQFSGVGDFSVDNLQLNQVPEPGSLALVVGALAGMAGIVRRRATR